jgi:hypothetical protein
MLTRAGLGRAEFTVFDTADVLKIDGTMHPAVRLPAPTALPLARP